MESLNDYAQKFETALRKKRPYKRYNRDMAHASIVVSTAFRHAKESIGLLSHELDPLLYGAPSFDRALNEFLEGGGRLDILVESNIHDDHPIWTHKEKWPGQVSIRRIPQDVVDNYQFNFMVVDDAGFRFEADRVNPHALVYFNLGPNDEESWMLPRLKEIFGTLEGYSQTIV